MFNRLPAGGRRSLAVWWLVPAVLIGSACSGAFQAPPLPAPAEIAGLEARLARDSADLAVLVRLGVAYREAGRMADARNVLQRATAREPEDPAAVFFLGLTYEELEQPAQARDLYARYLEIGSSGELKRRLRGRLPALEQQSLRLAVREAVAAEARLGAVEPEPGTVAIFPFLYHGEDPTLQPLSRAMAELLVTDLSQIGRLRVLERARVQLLLDELQLSARALVDPQTALRSGRLLSASRVVQGQIEGDESRVRLQAAVVGLGGEWDGRPISEADALRRLFELEKRLALGIFRSLGIELTPAERQRVMRQPTADLEALLAFGDCLEAEDAADYARAAAHCQRAVALDPGFELAQERGVRAAETAGALEASTRQLGRMGGSELALDQDPLTALQELLPDARGRGAASEALGREGFGQRGSIEIILRRP